jgi:L-ascorbate metabolism protein UlaG (beta-lactamase superfamily)
MKRRTFLKAIGIPSVLGVGGVFGYSRHANARSFYYDGPVSDHFDGVRFFLPGQTRDKTQAELWKWRTAGGKQAWPASFPSPFQDKPPPRVSGRGLRVTLIGHASFLVQTGGLNILVDPVFSDRASPFGFAGPRRVNAPGIAMADLTAIDWVLLTHNHYDHMDVASLRLIAARGPLKILSPLGNDVILRAAEVHAEMVSKDWQESHPLNGTVTAHLIPAKHWSARGLFDRRHALWSGFVLETPAGPVHVVGDTAYHAPLFTTVKASFGKPRLSLIPIGAFEPRWFMRDQHMGPEEAVQAFVDCGADAAIGCHWGTFQLTDEAVDVPPKLLAAELARRSIDNGRFQAFLPGQVWQNGVVKTG